MSPNFWKTIPVGLQVLSSTLIFQETVDAQEQNSDFTPVHQVHSRGDSIPSIDANISPPQFSPTPLENAVNRQESMASLTQVSQLSDVQPSDWEWQFLKDFQERYRIIQGFALVENRPISRYEFASILNTLLLNINKLDKHKLTNFATQNDLEGLNRLANQFSQELAIVSQKIERIEQILSNTFSTTSKLSGRVQFVATAVNGDKKADNSEEKIDSNITFSNRIQLNLDTSFSGKDRLKIGLRSGNIPSTRSATGTNMTNLGTRGDDENDLEVSGLEYRFPIGKRGRVFIAAKGAGLTDVTNTLNPLLDNSNKGAISRFGQRNPIYRQGGGAGIGVEYEISDRLNFGVAYNVDDTEKPDKGLGSSEYGIIAQLTFEPSKKSKIGLTYVHSHNNIRTRTGSKGANDPFDGDSEAISANSLGLQGTLSVNSDLTLSGWLGYTKATAKDLPNNPTASIFNWAITLALTDLGKEGSLAGIVIGQPPKLVDNEYLIAGETNTDQDTSLHLEAFYTFPINDSISITPGILIITNPEHNSSNDTIYIGTLRTTFSF